MSFSLLHNHVIHVGINRTVLAFHLDDNIHQTSIDVVGCLKRPVQKLSVTTYAAQDVAPSMLLMDTE